MGGITSSVVAKWYYLFKLKHDIAKLSTHGKTILFMETDFKYFVKN